MSGSGTPLAVERSVADGIRAALRIRTKFVALALATFVPIAVLVRGFS